MKKLLFFMLLILITLFFSCTDSDSVPVPETNTKPYADAGNIQRIINSGTLVTLNGKNSSDSDGDNLTYSWSMIDVPATSTSTLSSTTTYNPTFTPDLAGIYILELTVNDGSVDSFSDSVFITVDNTVPVADAGNDQNIYKLLIVTLDGSCSSVADNDDIIYSWSITSKPTNSNVTLSDPSMQNPTFKPDEYGTYIFQLIVNDKSIDSDSDTVAVTVVPPYENTLGMSFRLILPGTFTMGSPTEENETEHQVTLTSGFYMQTTEVTQKQWLDVMGGDNPSASCGIGDNYPVNNVSWNDIQNFLEAINALDDGIYRLPTEAEWEYAARAGSTTPYANDNTLDVMGWYSVNSGSTSHEVAQKTSNDWGLYDMHGNVWEWCSDWYGAYTGGETDPTGPLSGSYRVFRGGSWYCSAGDCRSAYRFLYFPGSRYGIMGFRLSRIP